MRCTMERFFIKDKNFYKTFFSLMIVVALQNLVAYSVNMLDNMMLGSYSQNALSGAATVNQIFFVVNQLAIAIGNALIVMCSQYWGKGDTGTIKKLTGIALSFSFFATILIFVICAVFPEQVLSLFTTSPDIIAEGRDYLGILKWTFVLFLISNLLISMLRSVETVRISFIISVVSLIVNGGINYTLIFGHFGFPEMGIRGAAIGTLAARSLEFLIVLIYIIKIDKKVQLFRGGTFWKIFLRRRNAENRKLWGDFVKVASPVIFSGLVWAAGRTLSVIDISIGVVLAGLLFILRIPLLSTYNLTEEATILADHLIMIMSIVMIGMSYQMPVSVGVIQGGGDTKFSMYMNLISTWGIVMPLSFLAAFVWKVPVEWVVVAVQSDQIFKCIPVFLRFRSYKWIRKLT